MEVFSLRSPIQDLALPERKIKQGKKGIYNEYGENAVAARI